MLCRNPECMAEVNPTAPFCGKCGAPVIAECPVCGTPIPAISGKKFCSQCGTMISEMRPKKAVPHEEPPLSPPHSSSSSATVITVSEVGPLLPGKEPVSVGGAVTDGIVPADQMKTNRKLGMFILLSIVTFGIYSIYFFSKVGTDLNRIAGRYDGKKTMHYCLVTFLLTPITFGIAPFVWYHKMSKRVGDELLRRGHEKTFGSSTFWLWGVMGSMILIGRFVYIHKLCKAMNTLAGDYNIRG